MIDAVITGDPIVDVIVRRPRFLDVIVGIGDSTVSEALGSEIESPGVSGNIVVPVANIAVPGQRGLTGAPGPGAEIETYTAAVDIGGHRAVSIDENGTIVYASSSLGLAAIGVVRDAVSSGGEVAVYRAGRVGGFTGLAPGSTYYLSENGLLALTPPTSVLIQPMGIAASSTELLVDPDYPTFI